jgi:hypothetical protein
VIYTKWALFALLDILLIPIWFLGAPVVSLFTREMPDTDEDLPSWGWWFGTYDNPPQGDERHQRNFGHLPKYIVRVLWLWRNPGYNFQKAIGVKYDPAYIVTYTGREDISDKYKKPGHYFAMCHTLDGEVKAWEFYCVYPWAFGKCIRIRLGYKIMTDKFGRYGFAPLVNTINPVKSYGD